MSTVTPPPHGAATPPAPPERRCPRCGSTLAPDQEWCLACGAAAETEIAEPRGWRVPIMLSGALGLLALIGIVLLIVALASGPEKLASATPTPAATTTPVPSTTPTPFASPSPGASVTPSPSPSGTSTPLPTTTASPTPSAGASTSFPGWTGGDGWTIIIESATTQAKAESVASAAQANGESVGILKSDDYSSLNAGYWVVFTGHYSSQSEAQSHLAEVRATHHDAYVRDIKQ